MIGSGISRMRDGMSAAGYPEPVFEPGKIWFSVTFRKIEESSFPTGEVTAQEKVVMAVASGALSRNEIMEKIGLKHREHFRKYFLVPTIESGLVEMTIPDKPNSRLQRYRLTERGRRELERLKKRFDRP